MYITSCYSRTLRKITRQTLKQDFFFIQKLFLKRVPSGSNILSFKDSFPIAIYLILIFLLTVYLYIIFGALTESNQITGTVLFLNSCEGLTIVLLERQSSLGPSGLCFFSQYADPDPFLKIFWCNNQNIGLFPLVLSPFNH